VINPFSVIIQSMLWSKGGERGVGLPEYVGKADAENARVGFKEPIVVSHSLAELVTDPIESNEGIKAISTFVGIFMENGSGTWRVPSSQVSDSVR